jgi:hypothetical protein
MIEVKAKTGVEMIRVLDEHDRELGIMTFYPSDLNLPARLDAGTKNIEEILKGAREKVLSMEKEAFLEEVPVIDSNIKAQLNYMFDTDISSVFGNTNLLTPTRNGFLVEGILDAILPVIKDCIQKTADQMEKKKDKYLGAYKK